MNIEIRVSVNGAQQLNSTLDKLEKVLTSLPEQLGDFAMDVARMTVLETFEGEGANPILGSPVWHPLADLTIEERLYLGYNAGPILVRSGLLRDSLTDPNDAGYVLDKKVGKGLYSGIMGTRDTRFERLQLGDYFANLPERPMWPVGSAEMRFVEMLTKELVREVEKAVRIT